MTSLERTVVKFHAGGWSECLEILILDPIRKQKRVFVVTSLFSKPSLFLINIDPACGMVCNEM